MLRKLRVILAVLFWLGTTLLFLDFTGTVHSWLGWMARIQFLPAVMALNFGVIACLVVLTLLLGRIYCSVICPLGVMQDAVARLGLLGRRNRNKYSYSRPLTLLRYIFLAIMVVAIALGLGSVVALLAPYSTYGRIVATFLSPLYTTVNNLLALMAERMDSYAFYQHEVWFRGLPAMLAAGVAFVVISILAWRNGRTYCNTVCPVGTVLGFLSRFSLMAPVIDTSKCNGCGLCARRCKSSCIDSKAHDIDYSRCVACMDCIDNCHQGAISYTVRPRRRSVDSDTVGARRGFMAVAGAIAGSAVVRAGEKTVDGGLAVIADKKTPVRKTRIVPPGAVSLRNVERRCTACQLCVSACPNGVLRPSSDMSVFLQPESSYERGYCRPECTRCSEVCPSGAIAVISREEKSSIQIGHAVWVRANCVPLTDGVECGNCARHCPVGAITMVPSDPADETSRKIPVVNDERCIGCGACENLCPARPFSAIYVEGHENHRVI
ncbi:MAG: 4Fe-4S binding protein [Duncaniella sp.]|nr:4Fe-4S binding protein [Duncaniella sp.]